MSDEVPVTPELLRTIPLPQPDKGGDKEERGRVMVVGGGAQVPGGALLAAVAALRAGAGKLQIATVKSTAPQLAVAVPEARVIGLPETASGEIAGAAAETLLTHVARCDAVLIGPGMLDETAAASLTADILDCGKRAGFVLDAAALSALPRQRDRLAALDSPAIITPHAGEMASLLDMEKTEVEAEPLRLAREAARRLGVITVLKGRVTHIAAPDGRAWRHEGGNVGLATSGSGDTLAGFIVALVARGAAPEQAAIWGVWLHGRAAERLAARQGGPLGFLARELPGEVPAIMVEMAD